MPDVLHEVGSVKLGAEQYRLVRDDGGRSWRQEFSDEPPWAEGTPALVSLPQSTWHLGGLKSHEGTPGTSEYGQNTDCRFPYRLLPSAQIVPMTGLSIPGHITYIFEAMNHIWLIAGRYVYRIADDDSIHLSKDFGLGVNGVMGIRWEEDYALVTTDADTQSLWKVSLGAFQANAFQGAGFTPPAFQTSLTTDTWTQTADVKAYRIAAGINRLFKVSRTGELKNVVSGLDPMVEANWADPIQCGEKDLPLNGLLAYERSVLVGKADGLFGVDTDGFGIPQIRRMLRDPNNCIGMAAYDPYVVVPHSRGVLRFAPGYVESIGLERELENESPIRGTFNAFVVDNQWLLGALPVNGDTYIMVARPRQGIEQGIGPMVWDTWLQWTGHACQAMHLSERTSPPRLYFDYKSSLVGYSNLGYTRLSAGGGAPDVEGSDYRFASSGRRWTTWYRFNDQQSKDFPKFDIAGRNLTAARYWEIYYSLDGVTYSNLDVDGVAMKIVADGLRTFYLPSSVVGREVQFRLDYVGDSNTVAGEVTYFEPYAAPRSRKVPLIGMLLRLADGIRHDEGLEGRSATEQFNDLVALAEQAASITTYGPWGDGVNGWVRSLQLKEVRQEGASGPEFLVDVVLQKREQS